MLNFRHVIVALLLSLTSSLLSLTADSAQDARGESAGERELNQQSREHRGRAREQDRRATAGRQR